MRARNQTTPCVELRFLLSAEPNPICCQALSSSVGLAPCGSSPAWTRHGPFNEWNDSLWLRWGAPPSCARTGRVSGTDARARRSTRIDFVLRESMRQG
jgi:hypothetical protein